MDGEGSRMGAEGEIGQWCKAREASGDLRLGARPLKPRVHQLVGADCLQERGHNFGCSFSRMVPKEKLNCELCAASTRRNQHGEWEVPCSWRGLLRAVPGQVPPRVGLGSGQDTKEKVLCAVPGEEQKHSFLLPLNFLTACENGFWSLNWVNQLPQERIFPDND